MKLFSGKKEQPLTGELGRRRAVQNQTRSSKTFFYHSNRSVETKQTKRQTLRSPLSTQKVSHAASYSLQRFGLLIVIIAAIVSLINVLSVSSNPTIVMLDQKQLGYLHTEAQYQQAAKKLLNSSFVNGNKITIDSSSISSELIKEFPELASVNIKIPLMGRNPIMFLTPNAVIMALTTGSGTSYAVDSNGEVLGILSAQDVSTQHLTDIQDESSAPIQIGQPILSSSTISFIQIVNYQVTHSNLVVSKLVLPAGASELDLYLLGHNYFVKFNLADSAPLQEVGTFLAVQHNLQVQGITPSQYIDVRVDGRAYYK
jgi:hypothetical protein